MIKLKNYKFILVLIIFFTIAISLNMEAKDNNLEQGKDLFFQVREDYYNGDNDIEKLIETAGQSNSYLEKVNNDYQKYLWQGQVEFLIAEMYEVKEEPRKAAQHFENSSELALKSIKKNKKSSEAHRLLADTYMRLMEYKGVIYLMTSAPKAVKLLQKAVKLDKENYTAFNSLGIYYINAPKIGGGDIDKGIGMFKKALNSKDKFDNFISYIWIANAYIKLKDKDQAIDSAKQALKIYPANKWAEDILKDAKEI